MDTDLGFCTGNGKKKKKIQGIDMGMGMGIMLVPYTLHFDLHLAVELNLMGGVNEIT